VPVGDVQILRKRYDVRVRELLGLDVLLFGRVVPVGLRRAYRDTADRGDYQMLLDTAMALGVTGGEATLDPAAFRRALKAIPGLPRIVVRIARPPELAYGADVLFGLWREAGLGPELVAVEAPAAAELERVLAPYPQAEALLGALVLGDGVFGRAALLAALARASQKRELANVDARLRASAQAVPIAWVTDARLVSRRLSGWRQGYLGDVDYSRVTLSNP
jgi:hypothetical protein